MLQKHYIIKILFARTNLIKKVMMDHYQTLFHQPIMFTEICPLQKVITKSYSCTLPNTNINIEIKFCDICF